MDGHDLTNCIQSWIPTVHDPNLSFSKRQSLLAIALDFHHSPVYVKVSRTNFLIIKEEEWYYYCLHMMRVLDFE
jgi:hypothetical protein